MVTCEFAAYTVERTKNYFGLRTVPWKRPCVATTTNALSGVPFVFRSQATLNRTPCAAPCVVGYEPCSKFSVGHGLERLPPSLRHYTPSPSPRGSTRLPRGSKVFGARKRFRERYRVVERVDTVCCVARLQHERLTATRHADARRFTGNGH